MSDIMNKTIGQVAYEAWGRLQTGLRIPEWNELSDENKTIWERAAITSVSHFYQGGISLIAVERLEQIEKHGYTMDHDDGHTECELAITAAELLVYGTSACIEDVNQRLGDVNFAEKWGLLPKLSRDRLHRLKVAGALVAAEIDREIRIQNGPQKP